MIEIKQISDTYLEGKHFTSSSVQKILIAVDTQGQSHIGCIWVEAQCYWYKANTYDMAGILDTIKAGDSVGTYMGSLTNRKESVFQYLDESELRRLQAPGTSVTSDNEYLALKQALEAFRSTSGSLQTQLT
jgi:hypothetical protein